MLIDSRHVADALAADGAAGTEIEIPADRPDGVLLSFRSDIKNTKAFALVQCLRSGNSPTIDLARSRITIKAKNDPSEVDLVSRITRIEQKDILVSVRTPGGSVAWRVAPVFGLRPVNLRQALEAINAAIRREARTDNDFFAMDQSGLRRIAGVTQEGFWVVSTEGKAPKGIGEAALDVELKAPMLFNLVDRRVILEAAERVVRAPGATAEQAALEAMQADLSLWREAARAGLPEACYMIGKCNQYGVGLSKDEAEAVKWFRKAADQGFAEGQAKLGVCYLAGRGVAKDETEAVKWLRKAADQGNAGGQFWVGLCYQRGLGVAKDEAEAVKWFRKAADQGNAGGQVWIGGCYSDGCGVAKDDAEAVKWFRKAADKGSADGQAALGGCYLIGLGVAKDEAEAAKWFRKAADQGEVGGQVWLGVCYRDGLGVAKDEAEAVKWFRKAAAAGHREAQDYLKSHGK